MKTPLVDKDCLLKKFAGKGGWTYTDIEEIPMDKSAPFGWVQVSGFIDTFELRQYKLMPMGNGKLFLPVRAEIRKKINKKEGDWVHVRLFVDDSSTVTAAEIIACLQDEPKAYAKFLTYPVAIRDEWIASIGKVQQDEEKVQKIVSLIDQLLNE
jgi:hypothetical protein